MNGQPQTLANNRTAQSLRHRPRFTSQARLIQNEAASRYRVPLDSFRSKRTPIFCTRGLEGQVSPESGRFRSIFGRVSIKLGPWTVANGFGAKDDVMYNEDEIRPVGQL